MLHMWKTVLILLVGMASMMSWNVRGLNAPNKQGEAKLLCNEEQIGLVGFLETKIKVNKIDQIATQMFSGWPYFTNLSCNYNGRIWVTWRPDYHAVVPVTMSSQIITCEVVYIPLQVSYFLSFVYAHNIKEERKELWSSIAAHHASCTKPWMLVGDFTQF